MLDKRNDVFSYGKPRPTYNNTVFYKIPLTDIDTNTNTCFCLFLIIISIWGSPVCTMFVVFSFLIFFCWTYLHPYYE